MEIAMKKQTSVALATAAALLAGVSVASAHPILPSGLPSGAMVAMWRQDTLTLSSAQQKTALHDLYTKALNQSAPSGFEATVGAVVPNSVTTAPVTSKAASDIPALKPYRFAMLQKKLVIVNPSDHKIAEVITR
jgi:hypothetical protein